MDERGGGLTMDDEDREYLKGRIFFRGPTHLGGKPFERDGDFSRMSARGWIFFIAWKAGLFISLYFLLTLLQNA
jgi:hypothetical protein